MLEAVKWLVSVTVAICWQLVLNRRATNSFTYPHTIEPPSYSIAEAANIIALSYRVPLNPFENITYITRDHLLPGLEDFYTNASESSNSSFNSTYQTDSNSEYPSGGLVTSRTFFALFLSLVGVGLGCWIARRRSASSRSRKTAHLANADHFDCATALIASSHLAWVPPEYDTGSIEYEMLKAQLKNTTAAFATVHSLCTDYQNWVSWYQVEQNILQGKVSRETEEHFATRESLTQQLNAEKAYRAVVEQELKGEIKTLNKDNAGLKKLKTSAAQVEAETLQLAKRTEEFDVRARHVKNREAMCEIDEQHVADLREENGQLKGDKHVREKTLRASENTIKTLRKQLKEEQERVGSAEDLRRNEIGKLQQVHRKHNTEAEQRYSDKLAEQKQLLTAQINKLAHQNQLQNTRINTLTDQKRSQNTRINELEAKIEAAGNETEEIGRLEAKLEAAGNENVKIGRLLRESEMLAATKESKVTGLTQEAMLSKTEYDRLAVEHKYLTEKATSFERELEAARNEKEKLGQQLREGEMLAATREAGVADLTREAFLAKAEYDKLVVEYKYLTEKATSLESELRAARNEHEKFGQLLLEAERCIGAKDVEIGDLTQEAILGKAEYGHLAAEHKYLTGKVTSLESELNMAKQQIESLNAEKGAAAGNQNCPISGNAEATNDGSTVMADVEFWPNNVDGIGGDNFEPSNNPWTYESNIVEANTTSMPSQGIFDPSQGTFDPSQGTFDPSQGMFDPSQAMFDLSQDLFDPSQDIFGQSIDPSTYEWNNTGADTTSMPSQGMFDPSQDTFDLSQAMFDLSQDIFDPSQGIFEQSIDPSLYEWNNTGADTTSMPLQGNFEPAIDPSLLGTNNSEANTTSMPLQGNFEPAIDPSLLGTNNSEANTTSVPSQGSFEPSNNLPTQGTNNSEANTTSVPSQGSAAPFEEPPSDHTMSTAASDVTCTFPNTATSFVAGGSSKPLSKDSTAQESNQALPKDSTAQESNQAPSTGTDTDVTMSTATNTKDDLTSWLDITPIEDQSQVASAAVLHTRIRLQPSIRKINPGRAVASRTSQASVAPPPPPPAPSRPDCVTLTPNKDTRGKASAGFMWCDGCGYHKKLTDSGICDVCDWQAEEARRKAAKAAAQASNGKKS